MTTTTSKPGRRLRVPVSPKQGDFLRSDADFTLFCGGVGSGKTAGGAMWAVRELCVGAGLGLIAANTYSQLSRVTLRAMIEALDRIGLRYVFGTRPPASWGKSAFTKHDGVLSARVGRSLRQVVAAQLGSYDYLRGIEIRWAWLDETRDTSPEAFDVVMGRLRGGGPDAARRMAVTTTPNGFNWLHDRFISNGERALTNRNVVFATSRDNPWLPPGYVESLLANYNPRLAAQEVEGRFVSLAEGQAYAEFSRERHIDATIMYRQDLPLVHSWDFNVNPLCSVVLQFDQKSGVVHVIDEIHIEGSARTRDATGEFVARYGPGGLGHKGQAKVYGDCSGNARRTNAEHTDFQIIRSEYEKAFPGRCQVVQRYGSNPGVAGSVQDVNSMLLNSKSQVRLKLHPRCEYTIRDLEQVSFKPGTREIDKSNPSLTHHSDALRYYISAEHPAVSSKMTAVMRSW